MEDYMEIAGKRHKGTKRVDSPHCGKNIPVLDIPQMTDERWNQIARAQAVARLARCGCPKPTETQIQAYYAFLRQLPALSDTILEELIREGGMAL